MLYISISYVVALCGSCKYCCYIIAYVSFIFFNRTIYRIDLLKDYYSKHELTQKENDEPVSPNP